MAVKVITIAQEPTETSEKWDERTNAWLVEHDGQIMQAQVGINKDGHSSLVVLYEEREEFRGPAVRQPLQTDQPEGEGP